MFVMIGKDDIPVPGFEECAHDTAGDTRTKIGQSLFMTWDMMSKVEQYELLMATFAKMGWRLVQVKRVTPE